MISSQIWFFSSDKRNKAVICYHIIIFKKRLHPLEAIYSEFVQQTINMF